jgi:hypothetical protein
VLAHYLLSLAAAQEFPALWLPLRSFLRWLNRHPAKHDLPIYILFILE